MLRADHNPTGRIATEATEEPSMRDYVQELSKLGFESEVARFYTKLSSQRGIEKIDLLIENSFCSTVMKLALRNLIGKRYKELCNEYKS